MELLLIFRHLSHFLFEVLLQRLFPLLNDLENLGKMVIYKLDLVFLVLKDSLKALIKVELVLDADVNL
jgi:hypothetical protein